MKAVLGQVLVVAAPLDADQASDAQEEERRRLDQSLLDVRQSRSKQIK